jgi:hypothetical protein
MIGISVHEINIDPLLFCIFPDMMPNICSFSRCIKKWSSSFCSPNKMNIYTYKWHNIKFLDIFYKYMKRGIKIKTITDIISRFF